MYKGDGSYKPGLISLETSLLDLLTKEKELVDKYNSAARAYEVAKYNGLRMTEYDKEINILREKIDNVRIEMRDYCSNNLYLKTSISDILYKS